VLDFTDGRGIKIDEQYVDAPAKVTLNISNTTFKTEEKSAIIVKSKAGADIALSNVNIEGVAADSANAVWVDEASEQYAEYVNVTGGTKVVEGKNIKVGEIYFTDLHEAMTTAKSNETVELLCDVDLAGTEWEPVSFKGKFNGNGYAIKNLTINKSGVSNTGFITSLNGTFENVTFTNPTVIGGENTGVVAGRAGGSAALAKDITVNGTIKVETTHSGYARAGVIVGGWGYGNYENIIVDGGDKAVSYVKHTGGGDGRYVAGIVGHADDVASYKNCTVKNITISGGWLCGGIAGPGPSDGLASGCYVENIDVNADYSGGMFGWYYGNGTIENSSIKNVTFTDGSANNGAIGGYSTNEDATVSNVTIENVKNEDGTSLLECKDGHKVEAVKKVEPTYNSTGIEAHYACKICGTLCSDAEGQNVVTMESLVIPKKEAPVVDYTPVTPSTPKDDVVTNETTNTGAAGETVVAPTTNADVSASTTTTKTETGEAKTETKVEQTTADKIVESAVANKSEEVVIDATTAPAPATGTTTPAVETTEAAVTIPTATIEIIAEQTDAAVTIKTDVAEIKLDNTAAAAIAEQAAEDGTISIVAVKTDEKVVEEETATGETETVTEVHFELKVVCSERGVIGDFQGGTVTVTVPVPEDMHTEELVAVYIDAQGHYHRVTGVKNANGTFTFTTDHFSSYAVMTAEEAEKAIAEQKAKVESIKLKLRSANSKTSKGKKAIKLTVSEVTDTGIDFDGYVIYRSTKKTSGFKKIYTTKTGTYYNTSAKKGVKYYYKAKGFVTIDGEKVYTGWSKKAIRTAK